VALRRLAALAALLAGCATAQIAGDYEAVTPVADGGGQRHVRVTLRADGRGAISSALSGRPSGFLSEGTWEREGNRVTLRLEGGSSMVFQHGGELLIAREWDRPVWGETGPGALTRIR
jgi:hypothetical protein